MPARKILPESGPILAAGVYDCLSSAIMQSAGFSAVALSGAGVAAASAGVPDLGLLSYGEMLHAARSVIARADVPVIVDADTGFGNELNVVRTCEDLAQAGASAIAIEDQTSPKRCGHLSGKSVIGTGEFISKIAAASDALAGTGVRLIARTDALAVNGLTDALDRAARAHEAGADVTFVEAPRTMAEVEEIGRRTPGRRMYNLATGGSSPQLSAAELNELGFDVVLVPGLALMPAIHAMRLAARAVLQSGSDSVLAEFRMSPRDIFEAVGLSRWLALDAAFSKP